MTGSDRRRYDVAKRTLDIAAASLLLVATSPLQAAVAVSVLLRLGRPIVFRQPRVGRNGRVFTLVKFRSMREPDPSRLLLSDGDRLTAFGRLLRATSLDELPTLINVLRGEMAMVGPRPLLVEYLPRYSAEQARRHEVRPGMTGLAQVNGRNRVDWDERLRLDVEYVDSRSLKQDFKIVLRTFAVVLLRRGIQAEGHATMHEFLGQGIDSHS
jgi:lipopolysaccharide/colanic/teichoic acid biosynthesis glycosyltransferase